MTTTYPRESPEAREAFARVASAVLDLRVAAKMRRSTPTLGDFLAAIRDRGEDVVYLSENPGP